MTGFADIPVLVKHMAMAILRERGARTFADALQIARGRLTQYGFLARGSDEGPVGNIRLTVKGQRREREHRRRPRRVSSEFDRLYAATFPGGEPDRETAKDREGGEPKVR